MIKAEIRSRSGVSAFVSGKEYIYEADYRKLKNKPSVNGKALDGDTKLTDIVPNFTGTLYADGWSGEKPYSQTAAVWGLAADMSPLADISASENSEQRGLEFAAWSCISYACTGENSVTFVCLDKKPVIDINFRIKAI